MVFFFLFFSQSIDRPLYKTGMLGCINFIRVFNAHYFNETMTFTLEIIN